MHNLIHWYVNKYYANFKVSIMAGSKYEQSVSQWDCAWTYLCLFLSIFFSSVKQKETLNVSIFDTSPSGNDVCRQAVRTERSYWLVNEQLEDPPLKPMADIDSITPYISRCAVSRHSSQTNGWYRFYHPLYL